MSTFDTYLFDLDGTLIDSLELILKSYRHTLTVHRGHAPPDRSWIAGIGTPLRAQLAPHANDEAEIEQMVETYRDHNFLHHDNMVRRFPGIRAAVSTVQACGAQLAIVTSKARAGAVRGLSVCGLDGLFDTVVAADDLSQHKPDPAPVLLALDLLNAGPDRAVFIGDSPFDMAAGRAAGVRTAAALWGFFSREELAGFDPDYWLSKPEQIATFAAL